MNSRNRKTAAPVRNGGFSYVFVLSHKLEGEDLLRRDLEIDEAVLADRELGFGELLKRHDAALAPGGAVIGRQIPLGCLSLAGGLRSFDRSAALVEADRVLYRLVGVVEEADDVALAVLTLLDGADVEVLVLQFEEGVRHRVLAAVLRRDLREREVEREALGHLPHLRLVVVAGEGVERILEGVLAEALRALVYLAVVLHRADADAQREGAQQRQIHRAVLVCVVDLVRLQAEVQQRDAVLAVVHRDEGVHRMLGHRLLVIEGVVELGDLALDDIELTLDVYVVGHDAGGESDLQVMVLGAVVDRRLDGDVFSALMQRDYAVDGNGHEVRASLLVALGAGFRKHPVERYAERRLELAAAVNGDAGRFGQRREDLFLLDGEMLPGIRYLGGILDNDTTSIGYYDYYIDPVTLDKYETVYGEYNNRDYIVYDEPLEEDSELELLDKSASAFNAMHKKGVHRFNKEASYEKGLRFATENKHTKAELAADPEQLMIYLDAHKPKKINVSLYIEGWDLDADNYTQGASFNANVSFKIDRLKVEEEY